MSSVLMDINQNAFSDVIHGKYTSLSLASTTISAISMASSMESKPNLGRVWAPPSENADKMNSSETGDPVLKPRIPLKKPPVAKKPLNLPPGVANKLNTMVPPKPVGKPVAAIRPQVRPRTSGDNADKNKSPPCAPVPAKRTLNIALPQKDPGKDSGVKLQNLNVTSNGSSSGVNKKMLGQKPLPPPKPRKQKIQEFHEKRVSMSDDTAMEREKLDRIHSLKDDDEEWLDEDDQERQRRASINASAIPQIIKYKRQQSIHGWRRSRKCQSKSPDHTLTKNETRRGGVSHISTIESDGDSSDSYADVEVFEEINARLPSSVKSETSETQDVSPVKAAMAIFKSAEKNNVINPPNFKINPKNTNAPRQFNRKKQSVRRRQTSHKELIVLPPSPARRSPKVTSPFVTSLDTALNKPLTNDTDNIRSAPPLPVKFKKEKEPTSDSEDDDWDYEVMEPQRLSVSSNISEHSYVDPEEVDRLASASSQRVDDEDIFCDPDKFPLYVDPGTCSPYAQTSHSGLSSSVESLTSISKEDKPSNNPEGRNSPNSSNVSQENGEVGGMPPCPPRISSLMPSEFNILAEVTKSDQENVPQMSSSVPTSLSSPSPPLPIKRNRRSRNNGTGALNSTVEKLEDEKESAQRGKCGIKRNRNKSRYVDSAPMFQEYQKYEKARITEMMREIPEDAEVNADPEMTTDRLLYRNAGTLQRTLWSDLPEVRKSGVLKTLTRRDLKLQETIFEVITSEASYLHSLNIFIDTFVKNIGILSELEKRQLFSNIEAIRDVSERFLLAMENRQEENIVLVDICDIVQEFAENAFQCYVVYCSNQSQQMRTYEELKSRSFGFNEIIRQLEARAICEALPFQSFITLPMQRITRLPLLIENIFHRANEDSPFYKSARTALIAIKQRVVECNEGARKMDRLYEMYEIQKQLKMDKQMALVSENRWLVKKGELSEIKYVKSKFPFSSTVKPVQEPIYLFLFNDILLVTRKKSDDSFVVEDHCLRNLCQVQAVEKPQQHPLLKRGVPANCMNILILVLLENYKKKQREIILNATKLSDRQRWIDVLTPDNTEDDDYEDGKIYEAWDCPQVQCTEAYTSSEPDELSLEVSDVINVYRKLPDGWYHGERLRDNEQGWFPAACVEAIHSQHVRAKNLRERYRLLCISQCFIQSKFGN